VNKSSASAMGNRVQVRQEFSCVLDVTYVLDRASVFCGESSFHYP
jgi:hypothetical protein